MAGLDVFLSPLVVGRCRRMTAMLFSWPGRAERLASVSSCRLVFNGDL